MVSIMNGKDLLSCDTLFFGRLGVYKSFGRTDRAIFRVDL